MPRKLNSFMIRWWHGDDAERLELEHVQSGRKALTSSLDDAVAWLEEQQALGQDAAPMKLTDDHEPLGDGNVKPDTPHRRIH